MEGNITVDLQEVVSRNRKIWFWILWNWTL